MFKEKANNIRQFRRKLRSDCENCCGLCCVALTFRAADGFPEDKKVGSPCVNLQPDFRCQVHQGLWTSGYKGCAAFDCFGAGPKVYQTTFQGIDWRKDPVTAKQMFQAFLIMRQLQEMLWYLDELLTLPRVSNLHKEIRSLYEGTVRLTELSPDNLLKLNVAEHRFIVSSLLQKASQIIRETARSRNKNEGAHIAKNKTRKRIVPGADLMGADLSNIDLSGSNLRGTYLIAADLKGTDLRAADLLGADLRDADLRGADLSSSLFLTQAQINVSKGDTRTKLPARFDRPAHWD